MRRKVFFCLFVFKQPLRKNGSCYRVRKAPCFLFLSFSFDSPVGSRIWPTETSSFYKYDSFYMQATYRCQYTSFQCFIVKRLPVQQCIIPYFTCYCYADLLQYTVTTCFHQMKGRTRRRRKKRRRGRGNEYRKIHINTQNM